MRHPELRPRPRPRPLPLIPVLALFALGLSLAPSGAAHAQVECEAPLVTEFTAGAADDFAPPTEPASPSSEFLAFLGSPAPVFDQTNSNRRFGHTFTGLPTGIVGATLTTRLRALTTVDATNDSLHLEFSPGPVFAWGRNLNSLTGKTWSSPDQHDLVLDLAALPPSGAGVTDVLAALADGDLDVFVQDDTAVDFVTLRVEHYPPPPPCAAPPWGLGGWWPLDETSGTTAADLVARHDGSHVNTPTPVAGMVGGALSFDGTEEVQVPDVPDHPRQSFFDFGASPGGDFSIDFWIRTTDTQFVSSVLEKRESPANPKGYAVFLVSGRLALQLAEGGSNFCDSVTPVGCTNYDSTRNVADGQWHFVAITVDRDRPDGIVWYVDGQEVAGARRNPTVRGDSLANGAPLRIAAHAFNGPSFAGTLDEIEIFGRVLSPEEIAALFAAGTSGKCKPTIYEPWDISMCPGDAEVEAHPEICNNSDQLEQFALTFASPPGACPNGPPSFTLHDAQPLLVPPRSCRTVTVDVARPPSFMLKDQRCFEITAQNLTTGQVTTHTTAVYGTLPCAEPVQDDGFEVVAGGSTEILFRLRNPTASPVTIPIEFEAMPAESGGVPVSLDGGEPGDVVSGQVTVPARGTAEVAVEAALLDFQPLVYQDVLLRDAATDAVLASAGIRSFTPGCTPGAAALCLNGGRFQVSVAWKDFAGNTGLGQAVPLTGDTGYFWFFSPSNVEVVLKVLDGRALNDHFWVFYGALSTVEYVITVTDTQTGNSKTFFNPSGNLASVADTSALPGAGSAGATAAAAAPARMEAAELPLPEAGSTGTCAPSATALCLNGGRFRVEVAWEDFAGSTGVGQAVPLSGDTGYFWFFGPDNVELILKVLDGRALNQHLWVFYGALSSVEYTVTVTDTATGSQKTYFNPSGNLGSVADTAAFED